MVYRDSGRKGLERRRGLTAAPEEEGDGESEDYGAAADCGRYGCDGAFGMGIVCSCVLTDRDDGCARVEGEVCECGYDDVRRTGVVGELGELKGLFVVVDE